MSLMRDYKPGDHVTVYYDWKTSHNDGVVIEPDPEEMPGGYIKVRLDKGGAPVWASPKHLEPKR